MRVGRLGMNDEDKTLTRASGAVSSWHQHVMLTRLVRDERFRHAAALQPACGGGRVLATKQAEGRTLSRTEVVRCLATAARRH